MIEFWTTRSDLGRVAIMTGLALLAFGVMCLAVNAGWREADPPYRGERRRPRRDRDVQAWHREPTGEHVLPRAPSWPVGETRRRLLLPLPCVDPADRHRHHRAEGTPREQTRTLHPGEVAAARARAPDWVRAERDWRDEVDSLDVDC